MQQITIKQGVNLPIAGAVENDNIIDVYSSEYALLADDFKYLKPKILVKEGDRVERGMPLLLDKNLHDLPHVSPFSGVVSKVMRGEKRAFLGVLIEKDTQKEWTYTTGDLKETLINTGLWMGFVSRPFGGAADPTVSPSAIFITAIDTRPLAPSVDVALKGRMEHFLIGVRTIAKLTEGTVYLCVAPDSSIPAIDEGNIKTVAFKGAHPAGLSGTHVHFLHPVCRNRQVWEINYQDVAAIGELFTDGTVNYSRIIATAGEGIHNPTLMRAPLGGNLFDITVGRVRQDDKYRLISGSCLYGTSITAEDRWMSRHHLQITCIPEGRESRLFSWLTTGFNLFSVKRIFMSHITKPKSYHFDTSMRGSPRSMIPVGSYESVMPLDILMTPFLKYLIIGDTEMAEKMGAIELLEEDLSLATYVSPSKVDFEPLLRQTLDLIRKEM